MLGLDLLQRLLGRDQHDLRDRHEEEPRPELLALRQGVEDELAELRPPSTCFVGRSTYENVQIGYASGLPFGGLTMCISLLAGTVLTSDAGRGDRAQARGDELAATGSAPRRTGSCSPARRRCRRSRSPPGVFLTTPATPELPRPPTPTGKLTCVETPTFDLNVGADRRQVVGEVVRRARAVGAPDGRDLRVRQVDLRVDLLDRRVVPLRDLAEVDVRDDRARSASGCSGRPAGCT